MNFYNYFSGESEAQRFHETQEHAHLHSYARLEGHYSGRSL